jgi:alpha-glucosidase
MRRLALCFILLLVSLRLDAGWQNIGNAESYVVRGGNTVVVKTTGATLEVSLLSDHVARVRLVPPAPAGKLPPDVSQAVVPTHWPAPSTEFADTPTALTLTTPALRVTIGKKPVRITIADSTGRILTQDHPDKGMAWMPSATGTAVRVWQVMPQDAHYYGLGEKSGALDKRNSMVTMWNSDIPAYGSATDPLYETIPFFMALEGGRAHGVFFDNTYWSSFDIGKEARDQYSFGAEGGELNYYVIAGPAPAAVIERYTALTGRMPLPPRWALGYQQCRWSYAPDSRVREIARGFRSRSIPCDVIYFDIDYMEGYRVFTWSSKNFPEPERLVRDLAADGFHVAVILDPGIKADSAYAAYRTGLEGKNFLMYPDGKVFYGDVWPGRCAFPDFSSENGRRWWGDQMEGIIRAGVRGYWNDMNEPSVFNVPTKTVDMNVIHNDGGLRTGHAKNHNVYGMQMTRATYEGAVRHNPAERPFVLTRASYAGGQRYSAAWTGDNVASWEHLSLALTMCLNFGVSGQPFCGSDIGGFIGYPTPELYTRWLQLGVFTPLMRSHSVINEKNKEPWEYGDAATAINRASIQLRYRMLPYIYNVMAEASASGIPAMRPMFLEYPSDGRFMQEGSSYMFGRDLLVAPVLGPEQREREVRFPAGTWYDFWTGAPVAGGKDLNVAAPLDRIPLFVREGAILPTQQVMQHTGEQPIDPLTLMVYPLQANGTASEPYYEDDGLSFDFQKGVLLRRQHMQQRIGQRLLVDIGAAEGSYVPPSRSLVVRIVNATNPPALVHVNGAVAAQLTAAATPGVIGWTFDAATHEIIVRCSDARTAQRIEINYE